MPERVLALLQRLVDVSERQAAALERLATMPQASTGPRTKRKRSAPIKPPAKTGETDELTKRRARKALERAGIKVG